MSDYLKRRLRDEIKQKLSKEELKQMEEEDEKE